MSVYSQFINNQFISRENRIEQRVEDIKAQRGKKGQIYDHLPEVKPLAFMHPDRYFIFLGELKRRFDIATDLSVNLEKRLKPFPIHSNIIISHMC